MSATSAPGSNTRWVVKIASQDDWTKYIDHLRSGDSLRLVNEGFTFDYQVTCQVTKDEFKEMQAHATDPAVQALMKDVLLVGGSQSRMMVNSESVPGKQCVRSIVLYVKNDSDGTYSVLIGRACQTKHVSWNKVSALSGSVVLGGTTIALVVLCTGGAGAAAVTAGALSSGGLLSLVAAKTVSDMNAPMEDVVTGYMIDQLESKGLLIRQQGKFVLDLSDHEM